MKGDNPLKCFTEVPQLNFDYVIKCVACQTALYYTCPVRYETQYNNKQLFSALTIILSNPYSTVIPKCGTYEKPEHEKITEWYNISHNSFK